MEIIEDKDLANFFTNSPLYTKIKFCETIDDNGEKLNFFEYLYQRGYNFYCSNDNDFSTFRFEKKYGDQLILNSPFDYKLEKNGKFSYTFHISASCQFCNAKMEFLLNLYTLNTYQAGTPFPPLYLRKFGQYPAIQRSPEKDVHNYLTEEDRVFYKKALANLSIGYGIGAYAYLRRIVENEIKRLVYDISQLNYPEVQKVRDAWTMFELNHQMTPLIESISQFLPASLMEIGNNPLKVLYKQASGGIHDFTEEECLDKARHIDVVLQFVIKHVSKLKFEYKQVIEALKNLE